MLLPLSIVAALVLVSQGVIQTLGRAADPDHRHRPEQTLALGPVASQVAIKQLGTNGGGFFNVNCAMPFENPTALSNFVEMLLILLIPAALTATFGRMVGNRRQGWALYAAMLAVLVVAIGVAYAAEQNGSPAQSEAGLELAAADGTTGGNLEGKEQRFGIAASAQWAAATTAASNGSVNSALDVLHRDRRAGPAGQLIATGEVIFGGVGSGLYGMLLFVLLAVFIAGLMVGRTPEYLGKKIEAREVKLVLIGTLVTPLLVLATTALAIATPYGDASIYNPGPQGFSETLYAYTSQGNNNGSAFAGYTGYVQPNAPGNVGAYGITFAEPARRPDDADRALRAAARRARRRRRRWPASGSPPPGPGRSAPTPRPSWSCSSAVIVIVAALTFLPALPARAGRPGPDRRSCSDAHAT